MLQIIGIMLAFQTRSVKYKELRDSKFVAIIIYVSSLILVILVIDTFLLNTYLNAYGAIFSLGIIILTTTFLLFTFVPKVSMQHNSPALFAAFYILQLYLRRFSSVMIQMIQTYQNQEKNSEPTVSTTTGRELGTSSDQEAKPQVSSLLERLQERDTTIEALEKEVAALKVQQLTRKYL